MSTERQDDALFVNALKDNELLAKYPSAKNKLPLKPKIVGADGLKLPKGVYVRASIRDSAVAKKILKITYKKTTTNETKTYIVEPYSFAYIKQNGGLKKALYAWDVEENKIKYFVVKNIIKAEVTEKRYECRFPIKIARGLEDLYGRPKEHKQ
jgi:predicted DNA-binding transcriptional regulator YafY